jgi:hypothetical protein
MLVHIGNDCNSKQLLRFDSEQLDGQHICGVGT